MSARTRPPAAPTEVPSPDASRRIDPVIDFVVAAVERGLVPDLLVRAGIRFLCGRRLAQFRELPPEALQDRERAHFERLVRSPLAVHVADANRQHYELPVEFFELVLGQNKKYSCGLFEKNAATLDEAERTALAVTIARAELFDGAQILELGCGWGSLTIEMARRYPKSTIVALSNSNSQRAFIEAKIRDAGFTNVTILTRDMTGVTDLGREFGLFDRVVSVEMFEHLRNYEVLFGRISSWLKSDGKLFVHIFTHREHSYLFETEGADNWMGKYFFTGGQMPGRYLFRSFQKHLNLERQWSWNGEHYRKTSDAWLANFDRHEDRIRGLMTATYGIPEAQRWYHRWRVFFLACSELFGYRAGTEWFVSHYLFSNRSASHRGSE